MTCVSYAVNPAKIITPIIDIANCKAEEPKNMLTIEILKELNLEQSDLEHIYKKILETGEFDNLNFYNLRAIIKIFGKEKYLILLNCINISFIMLLFFSPI